MSKLLTHKVLRQHEGDRFYKEGETREISKVDAKHLVDLGVLAEVSDQSEAEDEDEDDDADEASQGKAEKAPLNKAEKAAAANKSNES